MPQLQDTSRGEAVTGESRPAVVLMVPGFPADESDTSCLPPLQNYVAALAATRPDIDVHVIAFQYPYERDVYPWHGVTVHALAGANRARWRRLPTWGRAARTFMRLRSRGEVKVLHTFWLTDCTLVGQWLDRAVGVRHVASIGGRDALDSNPYLRRLDLRRMPVTAGSAFAADHFAQRGGGVARVIPLGLDTAHLESIAEPLERDIDILGVGSLIPLKNYAGFIDVVASLKNEFPALRACIVGGGPQHDALAARIARQGLQANVTLTGALPRDEAFRHMLRSRVLLHPSTYESQAYVFLEALFAGLDIVCHDVGHAGDSDKVHRCATTEELAAACSRLLRDPQPPRRQDVPTVTDTVRAFESLYGI